MLAVRNSSLWLEEGYSLFAREGIEGIQVERLARILKLNKSGFYHYFGGADLFFEDLISLHKSKALNYMRDIRKVRCIDPDYLQVVVNHKEAVLFQIQLLRTGNPLFLPVAESIDKEEEQHLGDVWSEYMGFQDNPDLALRYFTLVRDMFYTRMSPQNMTYSFMHSLMTEARDVMQNIARLPCMESSVTASEY